MTSLITIQRLCLFFCLSAVVSIFSDSLLAISVDALKTPMKDLKNDAFSWLFAVKIAAVATGSAFAVMKQSLTPFGVGAGITAGIHFFDKFIGDGSGALI